MASQAALRQRVLNKLYSNFEASRPAVQRINDVGGIDASTETLIVDDGTPITAGVIIEFDDGEQAYVSAVSTNTLTIWRGWNGTTAATHNDDEFIKINPVHTIAEIDDALTETMEDLRAQGLYVIRKGTAITLVAGTDEYELTETDVDPRRGVLALYYQESSTSETRAVPFHFVWDEGKAVHATSGAAVRIIHWGDQAAGDSLQVMYAATINALADSDDEPLLEDLLVTGAVGKLIAAKEGPRLHDPGRFTDRTIQPGSHLRTGGYFTASYQRMVWRYKAYLRARERNLPGTKWNRARRFVR